MKAKKPLLLAVLVVAVLAVALILPAVATGKSDNKPTAWATWGRDIQEVTETPLGVLEWQATWSVHLRERGDEIAGHEVMNWITESVPPVTPPQGHHLTTEIYDYEFAPGLEEGSWVATIIFRFDTSQWGPPWDTTWPDGVYHKFVLTDNPGSMPDHVSIHSQGEEPDGVDDFQFAVYDEDVHGVQVVVK